MTEEENRIRINECGVKRGGLSIQVSVIDTDVFLQVATALKELLLLVDEDTRQQYIDKLPILVTENVEEE